MKKKKTVIPFHVINGDFNARKFVKYDVMPYLVNEYEKAKKSVRPSSFEECKEFVKSRSMYMYWARTEYEIIIVDWPCAAESEKWDVHRQLMMNHDLATAVFMYNVGLTDTIVPPKTTEE